MPAAEASDRPRLLDRLDQIDAVWFEKVLRQAGYPEAQVACVRMAAIGNGNVSDAVRVLIDYGRPTTAPASVVCKFAASGAEAHAHGVNSGSYLREAGSYPLIAGSCRVPEVYWLDGREDAINLVMEDFTGRARGGDQIAGCNAAEAEAVVHELAKLHRAFHPLAPAAAPAWAMTMAGTADYWLDAIARAEPVLRDAVAARLSAAQWAAVVGAIAAAPAWYRAPLACATLTHGDPRADNILFLGAPEPPSIEAVLIDWQLTGVRNPMHDVAYFLSGSVPVDIRRGEEMRLLDRYRETFGSGYPQDDILGDYRVQLLSGLLTTVAAYGLLPLTPAVGALLMALLERNVAAVLDWDSLAAIRTSA